MRVYLPATLDSLAQWHAARLVAPPPLPGFAVTSGLRESYASGDIEELEYAALTAAARESLRLLEKSPSSPSRRVVVAVEAPDAHVSVQDATAAGRVELRAEVGWVDVYAAHVDEAQAEEVVRRAVSSLAAADLGDEDAAFAVDEAEGFELLWWATQEIPGLLGRE